MDPIQRSIERCRSRGVLVDANILLLYFIGKYDRQRIPNFKRTRKFAIEDYDVLTHLLSRFRSIVTTPAVLSEVNSLSGQMGEPAKREYFEEFARCITTLDERHVSSATVAKNELFAKLGLTDCGIMHLAKEGYLVLTDDLDLYVFLNLAGIDVLNFDYIRSSAWD
ncbi:MAG: PIN domain-containing protein [Planctomycetota bacterium]|jgi:hypothetical protein